MKVVSGRELDKKLSSFLEVCTPKEVLVSSPYLGRKAKEFFGDLDKEVFVEVVTTTTGESFLYHNSLDKKIDKIKVNDRMHAKAMIIDSEEGMSCGYLGSSNLTAGGFSYNEEINMFFTSISDKNVLGELREKILNIKTFRKKV